MAVDETLLETVSNGDTLPVLRLYGWDPPSLSLGYGQRYSDVDEFRLREHGWDVVRRPTGGRAILHTDELTYAVAAPAAHPLMNGGILPSYRQISTALLKGLLALEVPVRHESKYPLPAGSESGGAVCFEVPSNWEITVAGKKLVGSAQVRRKNGVLQHGSIPLHGDLTRIVEALYFENDTGRSRAARRLNRQAMTVEAAIGRTISWDVCAASIKSAFMDVFGIQFEESALSEGEKARAAVLKQEKYGNPDWTRRL